MNLNLESEWLEADGLGGFACGTVSGIRTRRYHGLLLAATRPPTGRMMLVNGFDAWVETPTGNYSITSQKYTPDVIHPDNGRALKGFSTSPWPTWSLRLNDGTLIRQELLVCHGQPTVMLAWNLETVRSGITLFVRPFFSGRDYHSLHHENSAFRFESQPIGLCRIWRPYDGVPAICLLANGEYSHQPHWYRSFLYDQERERGLDCTEDLAAPGILRFDLSRSEAFLVFSAEGGHAEEWKASDPTLTACRLREVEGRRRARFRHELSRSADTYFVRRGTGRTIVAGYPWFTDWGRDTFIALRGLALAGGLLHVAKSILLEWSGSVSRGMLPNRFPDDGNEPEFNSVDASLWYVIAVYEFLLASERAKLPISGPERRSLENAVREILDGYTAGTRFGIRADDDGLLMAGVSGVQLTWMDAKVGDWVVTPRIGKAVEVQALWLNALWCGAEMNRASGESKNPEKLQTSSRWRTLFDRGVSSLRRRFWNEKRGCLFDVVDCDHVQGKMDERLRPNQIFAVGGLPVGLLDPPRARKVVDAVEQALLTPLGLRSLAPGERDYAPQYSGGVQERDGAYHQGTVWPWLLCAFVDAWLRVRENTTETRREARERFVQPILAHLDEAGLGHVSEIADAESPHVPRGCPFQAWSLGELLRALELTQSHEANETESSPDSGEGCQGFQCDASRTSIR